MARVWALLEGWRLRQLPLCMVSHSMLHIGFNTELDMGFDTGLGVDWVEGTRKAPLARLARLEDVLHRAPGLGQPLHRLVQRGHLRRRELPPQGAQVLLHLRAQFAHHTHTSWMHAMAAAGGPPKGKAGAGALQGPQHLLTPCCTQSEGKRGEEPATQQEGESLRPTCARVLAPGMGTVPLHMHQLMATCRV